MNNDLISRSELKKALTSTPYNDYDDLIRTENLIDNAPTVEGRLMTEKELDERDSDSFETGYIKGICEQRPQGKWIVANFEEDYRDLKFKCSECGKIYEYTDFCKLARDTQCYPNFCLKCGADMRKEKTNE